MDDFFLKQHIQAATRQSNILDLFLTNNDAMILDIAVEDTKLSDHRIIEVLLTDNPAYQHMSLHLRDLRKTPSGASTCLKLTTQRSMKI